MTHGRQSVGFADYVDFADWLRFTAVMADIAAMTVSPRAHRQGSLAIRQIDVPARFGSADCFRTRRSVFDGLDNPANNGMLLDTTSYGIYTCKRYCGGQEPL
jgi:hypothetical protein